MSTKKPILKRFYNVRSVEYIQDGVSITLGGSQQTSKNIKGHFWLPSLLLQTDGAHTEDDIISKMSSEFNISKGDIKKVLEELYNNDCLIDNAEHQKCIKDMEFDRYDRHLLYYSIFNGTGIEVQQKIGRSKVVILGTGGIGCWVSLQLATAGVGELRLVDHDHIELSNLTRQILFTERDIGRNKVDVAKEALVSRNQKCRVIPINSRITSPDDVQKTIEGADLVVLSADSPAGIHGWVDEACQNQKIPYVNVGYIDDCGVIGPFTIPGETPCLSCLNETEFFLPPIMKEVNQRKQAPSYGPLNALISSVACIEIMKYLGGYSPLTTLGRRLVINGSTLVPRFIEYQRNSNCIACANEQAEAAKILPLEEVAPSSVSLWFNELIKQNLGIVECQPVNPQKNEFLEGQLEMIRQGKMNSLVAISSAGSILGRVDLKHLDRSVNRHVGEISFGVLKDHTTAGVALLREIEKMAVQQKRVTEFVYYILKRNTYFQNIFSQAGFQNVGTIPNFYHLADNSTDDRVIFYKKI